MVVTSGHFGKLRQDTFFNNRKILEHLLLIYVGRIKHISKIDFNVPKSFNGMNFSHLLRLCLDFECCWKLWTKAPSLRPATEDYFFLADFLN